MTEDISINRERCPWCRFHPDTRKVFVFFVVLAVLIAVARGTEDQSKLVARTRNRVIRTIPLGAHQEKVPRAGESSSPLIIEKVEKDSKP